MVITVAGDKGGSGKSVIAINIAAEFHRRGKQVLLVDADPQGTSQTWADVAIEKGHSPPTVVAMGVGLADHNQLPALAKKFEVTIIDCPGSHNEIQRSALMVSDLVLLPCTPNTVDVWSLATSIELVNKAKAIRPNLLARILINRKVARTNIGESVRSALSQCGLPLLNSELGSRVAYAEAPAAGLGVTLHDPKSQAASEIFALTDELQALLDHKPLRLVHATA
jgi:chromosome partitioning protein